MKMRISKLFHWLYASVMLMPIFAIGFKCLYTVFNPNAKDSYSGSFSYYEKVDTLLPSTYSNDTLLANNVYYCDEILAYDYFSEGDELCFKVLRNSFSFEQLDSIDNYDNEFGAFDNVVYFIGREDTLPYLIVELSDSVNGYINTIKFYGTVETGFSFNDCYFLIIDVDYTFADNVTEIQETEYTISRYVYHEGDGFLDNVFYYSVEQITEQPLFAWANNSFINQPIVYVSSLFGLPVDSPILTLLSFWLDISIIWLTFDVLMYLPLLIHRYLDKGVIE